MTNKIDELDATCQNKCIDIAGIRVPLLESYVMSGPGEKTGQLVHGAILCEVARVGMCVYVRAYVACVCGRVRVCSCVRMCACGCAVVRV